MLVQLNLRKGSINIKSLSGYDTDSFKKFHILLKRDYELVAKMHVNQLKNYLKVCGLKISGNKSDYFFCCGG